MNSILGDAFVIQFWKMSGQHLSLARRSLAKRGLVPAISGQTNGAILPRNVPLNNTDNPDVRFSSVKTSSCSFLRICQSRSVFASVAVRDRLVENFSPFRKEVKTPLQMKKLTHEYWKLRIIYAHRNPMKYFSSVNCSYLLSRERSWQYDYI